MSPDVHNYRYGMKSAAKQHEWTYILFLSLPKTFSVRAIFEAMRRPRKRWTKLFELSHVVESILRISLLHPRVGVDKRRDRLSVCPFWPTDKQTSGQTEIEEASKKNRWSCIKYFKQVFQLHQIHTKYCVGLSITKYRLLCNKIQNTLNVFQIRPTCI